MDDTRRSARLRVLAAPVLLSAWGVAAEMVRFGWSDVSRWFPDLAVGLGWVVFALIVLVRTTARGTGLLMLAFSGSWFVGNYAALEPPALAAVAVQGTYLHRAVLVQLLLTFPINRLSGRVVRALVLAAYGVSLVPALARSTPATLTVGTLVVGAAGWRVRESFGQARRPRVAALVAAILLTLALGAAATVRLTLPARDEVTLTAYQVVMLTIGALLAAAAVRMRRSGGVTDLVVDLADGPPSHMAQALARALGDPTIRLGYWSSARGAFVDAAGAPFPMDPEPGRFVSVVRSHEGYLVALDHDGAVTSTIDVAGSLEQAASLMVSNAQLQADLRDRVRELTAARRRLIETEAHERRSLELQLQSGAGRRLAALRATLGAAREVAAPPVATELAQASQELDRASDELARLSRGLYPAVLSTAGLPAALQMLRDQVPVQVDVVVDGAVPAHLEELVYFVCAEALVNVAKHAHAATATVNVVASDGRVLVHVTDDGVGVTSAEAGGGLGLRSLADRVAAYGGTLAVRGEQAAGTRLAVEVPLDGQPGPLDGMEAVSRPSPTGGP